MIDYDTFIVLQSFVGLLTLPVCVARTNCEGSWESKAVLVAATTILSLFVAFLVAQSAQFYY